MLEETDPFFSNSLEDVHSDSLKLKVAFNERTIHRLKDENAKQKQKIAHLEQDNTNKTKDKLSLIDKISKKENDLLKLQVEKTALERTIEVRTHRHVSEQHQYLTRGEKQSLERRVKQVEQQLYQSQAEIEKLMKQSHALMLQVETERASKNALEKQMALISTDFRMNAQKANQLQKLYAKKLELAQIQNRELKYKMEDLILELKLHERKEQIEGLLSYEDRIGTTSNTKYKDVKNQTPVEHLKTAESRGSEFPYAETYRENGCCCLQLSEEVADLEQMIELLKEKNQRQENELESFKKRCLNLQNIICGDSKRSYKN